MTSILNQQGFGQAGSPLTEKPQNFPALDGFRIVAVVAIFIYHTRDLAGFKPSVIFDSVAVLVTYFFSLSGFVLAHQYPAFENGAQFFRYLGSRFARIGPVCIACFVLTCCLNPMPVFDQTKLVASFWANLFLVQSWFPDKNFYACFNGPAWTLSVDAFLYLLLPIVLLICSRKWLLFGFSFLLCLGSSIAAFLLIPNSMEWALAIFPLTRIFDFSLGILAYRFSKSNHFDTVRTNAKLFDLCILAYAFLVAAGYALLKSYFLPALSASHSLTSFLIVKFVYHILPALGLTALILSLCGAKGFLAKAFAWKPLVAFSSVSCSLYLIHFPLIVSFKILTANLRTVFSPLLYGQIIVFIVACAILMFLVFEKPTRTLLNNLLDSFFKKHFPGKTRIRAANEKVRHETSLNPGVSQRIAVCSLIVAVISLLTIKSTVLALTVPEFNPEPISEQSAAALFAASLKSPANIIFNKKLTLLSVKASLQGNHLRLKTLWRASVGASPCKLAVHLLNGGNQIIAQAEDKLLVAPADKTILWSVDSEIDDVKCDQLKRIGLAVVANGQTMQAQCGKDCLTDWGGHRILINKEAL